MSLLKDLGKLAGTVAGLAVSAPVMVVGELTGNKFIKDVAEGAFNATVHTGKIVGEIADGTAKCASGILSQDITKIDEGLGEVVETSVKTVVGIGTGVVKTIENGVEAVASVAGGDMDTALRTGKKVLTGVAIGMVGIGICDVIGGIDMDHDGIPDIPETDEIGDRGGLDFVYENDPPVYWVNAPHTANGGYWRTMPDASLSNNLSAQ